MFWDQNITTLFVKVGFTRWPLLICSIIGTAIIIERCIYFFRIRFNYQDFIQSFFPFLKNNQLQKAIHYSREYSNPVAGLSGIYLQHLNDSNREGVLTREGSLLMEQVEARLRGLATIVHVAPLLGLLGTVAGLVTAFHQIEISSGQVQAQNLASGIWEALLSTVFGLVIAIPCMVFYHFFEGQADLIARRMQAIVSQLDSFFKKSSTEVSFQKSKLESDMDAKSTTESCN